MPIDNQLRRARVGIYNNNQLAQFTCLNTNPANSEISYISIFSYFCKLSIFLILLACFPVSPNLPSVYNYSFNISKVRIVNALIIKFLSFDYYAFILNRILLLESADIENNPGLCCFFH